MRSKEEETPSAFIHNSSCGSLFSDAELFINSLNSPSLHLPQKNLSSRSLSKWSESDLSDLSDFLSDSEGPAASILLSLRSALPSSPDSDWDSWESEEEQEGSWEDPWEEPPEVAMGNGETKEENLKREGMEEDEEWIGSSPSLPTKVRLTKAPNGSACEKHKRWKKRCPSDCPLRSPNFKTPKRRRLPSSSSNSSLSSLSSSPPSSPISSPVRLSTFRPSRRRSRACPLHSELHVRCPPLCSQRLRK